MKRLLIKNFGPIKEANLTLGQVNIITGMQSSGKSCVLKTACYCSWVEKRLELTQKVNGFGKDSAFIDIMADYYKMAGYIQDNTYIEYETRHLKFSYDHSSKTFKNTWKSKRWEYKRPKVSYIPADRNLVAALPFGHMIFCHYDLCIDRLQDNPNEHTLGEAIEHRLNSL